MDNKTDIFIGLLVVSVISLYSIVAYKHNKYLSFIAIAMLVVFICERAYVYYLIQETKKKVATDFHDAIALTKAGDFSAIPKILNLCVSGYLSAEDYKIGMEIIETSTKSDSEKVMAAFCQSLDKYYGET